MFQNLNQNKLRVSLFLVRVFDEHPTSCILPPCGSMLCFICNNFIIVELVVTVFQCAMAYEIQI